MTDDRRRVPTLLVTVCAGIILPLQIVAVSYLISIEHRLTVLESTTQNAVHRDSAPPRPITKNP
jgi:hypothetical protein